MYRYSAFTLTIDSEFELPGFPPGVGEAQVTIRAGKVPRTRHRATLEEEFAFPRGLAGFHLREGREIVVDPVPGADPGVLRNVLMGRIMAFLMRQRGWLPLHASCVAVKGQGVLFLGPCGAGKSTTAAAFHARGHEVVADDLGAVQVIDGICWLQPASPYLRLLDDARGVLPGLESRPGIQLGKHHFILNQPARGANPANARLPVKRIYMLAYGDKLESAIIPPAPALVWLDACSFVKRWRMERSVLENGLAQCAAVNAAVPLRRLTRPRSLSALPDVVRFIEGELGHAG
jgi:HPr Serine kinase C-terminal domain